MIMFNFLDRAYGLWWDTISIHDKGVLEFVKEQQFFIDSHIILVVQCFDYLLKTPFQNIAHFSLPSFLDGFVFFNWRGVSLIRREKKGIYGYCTCLPVKGTFYLSWKVRLYRTILHFLNVHDSCTLSVCDEKLRNDLIKGTDYTPDYLGSI